MSKDNRVLDFTGVHNFRDYGGYTVAGGGRLKRGLLWRSGEHSAASDADLTRIDALGLATVFDLRSDAERLRQPCRRGPDFAGQVLFEPDVLVKTAPHISSATLRKRDAATTREGMIKSYTTMPFRPGLKAMMRRYLAELALGKGPSVVHCMAGKDRTGLAVAMLHHAVGVHPDDIMADYLLTNTAGDVAARIRAGAASVRSQTGELAPDVLAVMMGVEPEYLETAWASIREHYGTVSEYLSQELGCDASRCSILQSKFVA